MYEENYQLLANAVVQQAAEDYFCLKAGFPVRPQNKEVTVRNLKRFFYSRDFELMTDLNPDYLINLLEQKAKSMRTDYNIVKIKSKYYACKIGNPEPISKGYKKKKDALQEAADLSGIQYVYYMKIRKRDGIEMLKV